MKKFAIAMLLMHAIRSAGPTTTTCLPDANGKRRLPAGVCAICFADGVVRLSACVCAS